MIYPDVCVEVWRKRWGLRKYVSNCHECKQPQTPNRPFVTKNLAGLGMENCENCGAKCRLYSSVPRTDSEIAAWNEAVGDWL